jgi:uncharacterized protein YprB with RNaseH-like and TPR domain
VRIENSFIPVRGIDERTERELWRAGVTHWEAFDGSVVGPVVAERVAAFVDLAGDHLATGEARFFGEVFPAGSHWRLYEDFREEACFLDIETTGLRKRSDAVTVVSLHRGGETTTLVRGRDLTRESLVRAIAPAKLLVTFNGKRFDAPFLESAFDLGLDLPHLDLMYPAREVGLTGGLKAIERRVGIARDRTDISGLDAVRLWHEHERGDDAALETLVEYNRADARNLEALADHVTAELHERVFVSACSSSVGRS